MKTVRGLVVVLASVIGLGGAWWQDAVVAAAGATSAPTRPAPEVCDAHGFRALLEAVQQRAEDLDRREQDVAARQASLTAVRRAVAAELVRLEGVAKSLGIGDAGAGGTSIAKVYETMSPEDAAPLLDRLDDATLRAVLGRMRDRQLGAILAAMSPDRAVAITKALAGPAGTTAPSR